VGTVAWTAIALLGASVLGSFGAFFYLGGRMEALGARLDARLDTLGGRLDARLDTLARTLEEHVQHHVR
jgi:hypothetical protein